MYTEEKTMKQMISLILALCLLCCAMPAGAEEAAGAKAAAIERKTVPVYFGQAGKVLEDLPLYYLDGVKDLPYMDLEELAPALNRIYRKTMDLDQDLYEGGYDEETRMFIVYYEHAAAAVVFNLADQTIQLVDYELINSMNGKLMDILYASGYNSETGLPELFERTPQGQLARKGSIRTIELELYDLRILERDGKRLLPMHLLMTLMFGVPNGAMVNFNGEALFMGGTKMLSEKERDPETGRVVENRTEMGELFYSAPRALRSRELATVGLAELCLIMDTFYGLKEAHNIDSFYELIVNLEMEDAFLDPDPAKADQALADLINYYLDDLHSGYLHNSHLTGLDEEIRMGDGYSSASYDRIMYMMMEAKDAVMPEGRYAYHEVGDTAFIWFDEFIANEGIDYYGLNLDDEASIQDTISLMMFAHHQITRKDSPIKNVVLDLSTNSGGDADAAVYIMGWFLGEAQLSTVSTVSGAQATNIYHVDVNADHVFDEEDSLYRNYNLYCLISPLSFSCGNLVPWAFHASGMVTLIGDTSGGGSCVVLPMATAWGTIFQTSGPSRLAFIKNGSYYDIDRGVDPDVHLTNPMTYFDREALTEIIHGLR